MSLSLDIKRIVKEGVNSFKRNSLVSLAAIVVMTMSLLVLSGVLFLNAVLGFSLGQLDDRVDVNIYFFPDAPEEEITQLASRIEDFPEVRDVVYVSREEAFADFQEKHQDDELIQRSLLELGGNPLGASINVRAFESADYDSIVASIEADPLVANTEFVERINYYDNKTLIERLSQFSTISRTVGYAIMMFFSAVAILVIISTMRIAIFASKNEIIVKRLVGAEHRYVRGPFLVQGMLYGVVSAVVTMLILLPLTQRIGVYTETFFGGMNIAQYYQTNAFQIFFILLAFAIILGVVASAISVKKYLKV